MTTKNELKNTIGRLLRQAINLKGLSLTAFAEASDINYRALQDYLAGKKAPGAEALAKIAAQGIDINWLLLGPDGLIEAFPEEQARPQQRPPWLSSTKIAAQVIQLAISKTEQSAEKLEASGEKINNNDRIDILAQYYAMYTSILDTLMKVGASDDDLTKLVDELNAQPLPPAKRAAPDIGHQ